MNEWWSIEAWGYGPSPFQHAGWLWGGLREASFFIDAMGGTFPFASYRVRGSRSGIVLGHQGTGSVAGPAPTAGPSGWYLVRAVAGSLFIWLWTNAQSAADIDGRMRFYNKARLYQWPSMRPASGLAGLGRVCGCGSGRAA